MPIKNSLNVVVVIILVLAAVIGAQAQTPSDLEKSLVELKKEIEAAKAETKAYRAEQARREAREKADRAARAKKRWQEAESEATAARDRAGRIRPSKKNEEPLNQVDLRFAVEPRLRPIIQAKSPADQTKIVTALAVERDLLDAKIKRANRRWNCKWLRLGCIGRK